MPYAYHHGHFGSVDTKTLNVAGNRVVAGAHSTGKVVVDVSATGAIPLTAATHEDSLYIFSKTPGGARACTLPALSTMSIGGTINFIVARASGTSTNVITITLHGDDTTKIIGCVTVVTGGDAATGTFVTDLLATEGDAVGVTNVVLSEDTSNDAGASGTQLTFTCVGSSTRYWLISGMVKTKDPNGNHSAFFT